MGRQFGQQELCPRPKDPVTASVVAASFTTASAPATYT